MSGLSMKLTAGRMVTLSEMIAVVMPHARSAGDVVVEGIQETSPVRTRALQRSFAEGQSSVLGRVIRVPVGSHLVYAAYQNYRTRNRGYAQRGIKNSTARAQQVLNEGVRADARKLWKAA